MTKISFMNGAILTENGFMHGRLSIQNGVIKTLDSTQQDQNRGEDLIIDLDGGYLLPGFIDTQVNGGGGVLFNDLPCVDSIASIASAHLAYGTTGFLPTLISDDLDKVYAAMRAVEEAIDIGIPGVLGIHIEGPFLSEARKGTHDSSKFKRLDEQGIKLLSSLKRGKTLVTLAPEETNTSEIKALSERGVIVAAGHTDASYSVMRDAFAAGVTGITHLFNAMSPLSHRAPGVVGAALENQTAYCGIIVDGHHVDAVALRLAIRCRPKDRFMLVTDAMPTVGSSEKTFKLQNLSITAENGVCINEYGTLAGSDLNMATALRNAVNMLGLSIDEASFMASSASAHFLGLDRQYGYLKVGSTADMVWLSKSLTLNAVWRQGQRVS